MDSDAGIPRGALGAWLRTQREARGVSLGEIAEASKISLRHLQALESDRFDALPAPVFVRGFLREYARVVGLDPDEVVNVYLMAAAEEASDESSEELPRQPAGMSPSPIGYGLLVAAVIILLLALAAGISYWVGRRGESGSNGQGAPDGGSAAAAASGQAAPRPAAPEDLSAAAMPPAESAARKPAEVPVTADAADAAEAPASQAEPVVAPPATPPPAAPPAPAPLRVVLEFQQDCWVELVVDGRRRPSELKAGGEVLALEAQDSVLLTLGNAPAVRVEVNGEPLPLPRDGTRVLHDFRIDRDSVPGAAAPAAPAEP